MNKLTILILTLCFELNSYAQSTGEEAYINDPDGYTNVRDGQSGSTNILTTIKAGELFWFRPSEQSNWWQVTKSDGTTGFVHNSRIVNVATQADEASKLMNAIRTTDSNNVEFGEFSNERLYILAQQFPKSFTIAFQNADKQTRNLVIEELETPIHDMIDFTLTYRQIKNVEPTLDSTAGILEAIKAAGASLKIDVTK